MNTRKVSESEVLNALLRISMTVDGHDVPASQLQQIFKNLQPVEQYDHRTAVIINAGQKCLDQRDWLQIERGNLKSDLFNLLHQAENATNDGLNAGQKTELLMQVLVKSKVLGHTQILSNEMYERASEYLLQATTYILSASVSLSPGLNQNINPAVKGQPSDRQLSLQLKGLNDIISSIVGELKVAEVAVQHLADGADEDFEAQVQARTLTAIIAFAKNFVNRSVGLSNLSASCLEQFGSLPPAQEKASKQWLVAYAMTAATAVGAVNKMVVDALLAYGNITEPSADPRGQAELAGPAHRDTGALR